MRSRDEDWELEGDDRRAPDGHIAVEITLRKVEPLDELVFFIERCAARLDEVVATTGRCTVTICPVWLPNGIRQFEVHVRLICTDGLAEVRHMARDLFAAIQDAFDGVRYRLTGEQSGIHRTPARATANTEGTAGTVPLTDRRIVGRKETA